MSTSAPNKPASGGPSIRLNLSASAAAVNASKANTGAPAATPASKRRRFQPPATLRPNIAHANNLDLLHQSTSLIFCFDKPASADKDPSWYCTATSTLYVRDESPAATVTPGAPSILPLALHLRKTAQVQTLTVESISKSNPTSLKPLQCSVQHLDPLERVLLKPPASFCDDEGDEWTSKRRHQADSQSSRGAVGMTNAIRAASLASTLGELRISAVHQPVTTAQHKANQVAIVDCWRRDLEGSSSSSSGGGEARQALQEKLNTRTERPRQERIDHIVKLLSDPSSRSFKITVSYKLALNSGAEDGHFGGIHASYAGQSPHIYTTMGVYGDHEGPRSFMPVLDSASTRHRASRELYVQVTAPMKDGLSVVGMGEDYGVQSTYLHEKNVNGSDSIELMFGQIHSSMLREIFEGSAATSMSDSEGPHLIPPESETVVALESIYATSAWMSCSWLPISPRAVGFAVGPFRVLEDPEYFSPVDEEDTSEEAEYSREALESARENGEGIRQAYFCPIFARKLIHQHADARLLPNTEFYISPMTKREKDMLEKLDQSVLTATAGVAHRALSLMRDILAFPAFRTVSYTQVWIPRAVHGGSTSGALHCCPEVLINPFLGGAIMDSRLLPPPGHRLPYHQGGRILQMLQSRCAVRGWIISAVPLGGRDDVGHGYIYGLIESFIMSLYERGHGAHGEGGAKGSAFFTKRYSMSSGLNSTNLDFFPVQNIEDEELDVVIGAVVGAVPVEDRNNDQLWRSASNGTESHTSAMDEFAVRMMLCKDAVDTLERGNDKDRYVPTPSVGWLGSHLSLSFLSSNATSSSDVGCGALELVHPTGGLPYRSLKCDILRRVVEGRAGVANFIRLIRATFIAAHLDDTGQSEIKYPPEKKKKKKSEKESADGDEKKSSEADATLGPKPRFIVCVNELLKKKGLTHTLFTRALQNLAGRIREAQLLGTLVDAEKDSTDPRTQHPFLDPEGFPNSYVRGASHLYLRVGAYVEPSKDAVKGIQMQSYAEPVVPEGGIAYGGPITVRVVENEGQFREFVKDLAPDGSRRDWGTTFLHAKPVTLPKAQTAASGIIESASKDPSKNSAGNNSDKGPSQEKILGVGGSNRGPFTEDGIHSAGYQAIELIRLTNLTPLLWIRVDPMGLYCGRITVFQPDACLAEQLFHDGDAGAQVDALRALAERPLRIQGSVKVTSIYDVPISELPARVMGDCLRGTPALHSSLPHTPAVRAQAALCIAQWQNNKAPANKNTVGANHWVGMHLLIQYFRERFYNNGVVMPVKFNRVVLKKNSTNTSENQEINPSNPNQTTDNAAYHYLDSFDEGADRAAVMNEVDEVEVEEDEEYRVRSAVITAIASIRAKDGLTPAGAVDFLETVLDAVDAEMVGNLVSPDEEVMIGKKNRQRKSDEDEVDEDLNDGLIPSLPFVSSGLVADALLALCHINASPAVITDPSTGKPVQSKADHPVTKLMEICRRWLEWELYREGIRMEIESSCQSGVSGVCYDTIAPCAIIALSSLSILRQSTTDTSASMDASPGESEGEDAQKRRTKFNEAASASFYMKIFDSKPYRSDVTRAACAQAIACICCAADRFESESQKPVGLLTALEFMLERITKKSTSPGLRQTLAQLMMDACTGKICSMQRVGVIGGKNDLVVSAARFLNGPLGASHGGDNGSAFVSSVTQDSNPAACAVNDGARRGIRLLSRAGHPRETGLGEKLIVRIALLATNLWRTINGESISLTGEVPDIGVCANDGTLRCSLLALWQWLWPKGCFAVLQVQTWKDHEGTKHYLDIGADKVMKTTTEEKEAATAEEGLLCDLSALVEQEIQRQQWRGEMYMKAYEYSKSADAGKAVDAAAAEQGIGQPLPPIQRDNAFKAGGWIASAAQQRRSKGLDGGTAVTKLRIRKSGD
jgi:hypothetical protein